MSFFKKLKKSFSKVAKFAQVAAPIAAGFFPGGGVATSILSRAGTFSKIAGGVARARKLVAPALTLAKTIQQSKSRGKGFPGLPSYDARYSVQGAPNGLQGRLGRVYARRIHQLRRAPGRRAGIGTAMTYRRAAAFKRPSVYHARMRARSRWAV